MRIAHFFKFIVPSVFLIVGGVSLVTWNPGAPRVAHAAEPAPGPKMVEESMHEFMEYVFEPGYKRLKAGMAIEAKDAAAWKGIKGEALSLAESSNLLFSRAPKEGAADWATHASAAREQAAKLYLAAKAKDAAVAKESYTNMLTKCNACHTQFAKGKHQLAP